MEKIVKVKFYASLREMLNVNKIEVKIENSKFISLMEKLKENLKDKINLIADEKLRLKDNLMISINNNLVKHSDLNKIELKNGDMVDFMPLPSGG
ncbi:MoaD family protein [Candidatus Bathyarchaeota archaeon]|nr:MoaD family protein [Candidatus Bathyarchaeota archaeon]